MLLSATICPPSYYRAGWLKMQERDHSLKDQIAEGARQMRYQPESIRILGMGGNFTSVGLQVTLCDPMWHVSSRSGVATLRTAIHLLLTYMSILQLLFVNSPTPHSNPTYAVLSTSSCFTVSAIGTLVSVGKSSQ